MDHASIAMCFGRIILLMFLEGVVLAGKPVTLNTESPTMLRFAAALTVAVGLGIAAIGRLVNRFTDARCAQLSA